MLEAKNSKIFDLLEFKENAGEQSDEENAEGRLPAFRLKSRSIKNESPKVRINDKKCSSVQRFYNSNDRSVNLSDRIGIDDDAHSDENTGVCQSKRFVIKRKIKSKFNKHIKKIKNKSKSRNRKNKKRIPLDFQMDLWRKKRALIKKYRNGNFGSMNIQISSDVKINNYGASFREPGFITPFKSYDTNEDCDRHQLSQNNRRSKINSKDKILDSIDEHPIFELKQTECTKDDNFESTNEDKLERLKSEVIKSNGFHEEEVKPEEVKSEEVKSRITYSEVSNTINNPQVLQSLSQLRPPQIQQNCPSVPVPANNLPYYSFDSLSENNSKNQRSDNSKNQSCSMNYIQNNKSSPKKGSTSSLYSSQVDSNMNPIQIKSIKHNFKNIDTKSSSGLSRNRNIMN